MQIQLHHTVRTATSTSPTTTTATTSTTLQLQLQLQLQLLHNFNNISYTITATKNTLQLKLQLRCSSRHHYMLHCGWGDPCNHSKNHNHLSVHQWIRSAIHASQKLTSPIASYIWNVRHRLVRYYWYFSLFLTVEKAMSWRDVPCRISLSHPIGRLVMVSKWGAVLVVVNTNFALVITNHAQF